MGVLSEDEPVNSNWTVKIYVFIFIWFLIIISSPFVDTILASHKSATDGQNLTAYGSLVQAFAMVLGIVGFNVLGSYGIV